MSTHTPRRPLVRPRPSVLNSSLNTASSPNLGVSYSSQHPLLPNPHLAGLSASIALARKASLNQLTSGTLATIPDGSVGYGLTPVRDEASSHANMGPVTPTINRVLNEGAGDREIDVGDLVNVPGGMHGTVKFVGSVRGKKGVFAGVELSKEWAARGKNDGDVDGYVCPGPPNQIHVMVNITAYNLSLVLINVCLGYDTSRPQCPAQAFSCLSIELLSVLRQRYHPALFLLHLRHPHLVASILVAVRTTTPTHRQHHQCRSSANRLGPVEQRVRSSSPGHDPLSRDPSRLSAEYRILHLPLLQGHQWPDRSCRKARSEDPVTYLVQRPVNSPGA